MGRIEELQWPPWSLPASARACTEWSLPPVDPTSVGTPHCHLLHRITHIFSSSPSWKLCVGTLTHPEPRTLPYMRIEHCIPAGHVDPRGKGLGVDFAHRHTRNAPRRQHRGHRSTCGQAPLLPCECAPPGRPSLALLARSQTTPPAPAPLHSKKCCSLNACVHGILPLCMPAIQAAPADSASLTRELRGTPPFLNMRIRYYDQKSTRSEQHCREHITKQWAEKAHCRAQDSAPTTPEALTMSPGGPRRSLK